MIVALRILKLIGWAILLWAALIIIATSAKAQSAAQVLKEATRAHDGEKAMQKMNALQAQGRLTSTSLVLRSELPANRALPQLQMLQGERRERKAEGS